MEKIDLHNYQAYFLDYVEGNLSEQQKVELEKFLNRNPHLRQELNAFENIKLPTSQHGDQDWINLKKPNVAAITSNQEIRDEFFFKAVENALQPVEEKMLNEVLKNTELNKEFERWKKTKLSASTEEIQKDELFEFGLDQPVSDFNFEYYLIARTEGLLNDEKNRELEKFAASKPDGKKHLALADQLRLQPAVGIFFPDKNKLYKKESRPVVLWFYRAAAVAVLLVMAAFIVTFLNHPFADKATLTQNTDREEITTNHEKTTTQMDSMALDDIINEPYDETHVPEIDSIKSKPIVPNIYRNSNDQNRDEVLRADLNLEKIEIFKPHEIPVQLEYAELAVSDRDVYESPYRQMKEESKLLAVVTSIPATLGDFFNRKINRHDESEYLLPVDVAKRFGTVGEMLNAEIKKESTLVEGEEVLTYSFRIGNFSVSHSKTK